MQIQVSISENSNILSENINPKGCEMFLKTFTLAKLILLEILREILKAFFKTQKC